MKNFVPLYLSAFAVFLICDAVWLGVVARPFYAREIGPLLLEDPDFAVAGAFYVLYLVGVVAFAMLPGLQSGSLRTTSWRAALFGLIAYATYDLTNLATLKGFSAVVAIVDMAWGTILTATAATVGLWIARRWLVRA